MAIAELSDVEQRALEVARDHGHAAILASFVFDVVFAKPGGKRLQTGEKLTARRARKRGVNQQNAQTELGNVLKILGRGARSDAEWALLGALGVRGFVDRLRDATSATADAEIEHFLDGVIWLELNSSCRPSHFVRHLLSDDERAALVDALSKQIAAAEDDAQQGDMSSCALNAARISLLQRDGGSAAVSELARIHSFNIEPQSDPAVVLSVASSHAPRPLDPAKQPERAQPQSIRPSSRPYSSAPREPSGRHSLPEREADSTPLRNSTTPPSVRGTSLEGRLGRPPAGAFGQTIRVVTGWILVRPAWVLLLWLIGWRKRCRVDLDGDQLRVRQQRRIFGITYLRSEEIIPVSSLTSVQLQVRAQLLGYLLGLVVLFAMAFAAGIVGTDGMELGNTALWLTAGSLLALGIGLDILLATLATSFGKRVVCMLEFGRRKLCLHNVDVSAATRLRDALAIQLAEPTPDAPNTSQNEATAQSPAEAKAANVL